MGYPVMATSQLTNEQVVELIRQLPPDQKRTALLTLANDAQASRSARMDYAATQLRRLSAEHGLDWEAMSEEQREEFVDDLIHEDRLCNT